MVFLSGAWKYVFEPSAVPTVNLNHNAITVDQERAAVIRLQLFEWINQ